MSGLQIAVVGATGAVGRELIEALPDSGLPIGGIRAIASRSTRQLDIEVSGKSQRIHLMPESLADSAVVEGVDLVIFATPPEVTRQHAPAIADQGIATIDIGGALPQLAALCVPSISDEPLEQFAETRLISSPSAPGVALAAVLSPLMRLGADAVKGTVMLSASAAGRAGIDELGQQVLALYSSGEPPRSVFPSGLAFDLISQVGELQDGWTTTERRIALEVAALTHMPPQSIGLTVAMVPLFAGIALSLYIQIDPLPDEEELQHFLSESTMLRLGDPVPGPRRLVGRPGIHVGRVRPDPLGSGIHLWAAMDNIRAGAVENTLQIAQMLWREGML
ncbi:MAG: aspartate-semialdehyde dehydrogenase [Myxococcota bacterium]|jgi:aspartate-semialdehyde dehydrogenase